MSVQFSGKTEPTPIVFLADAKEKEEKEKERNRTKPIPADKLAMRLVRMLERYRER